MRLAPQRPLRPAATIVESAFVIGIFLLFIFGLIEYGRLLMTKQIMENAAREGARWAVVHTYNGTTAQVQDQVDHYLVVAKNQMVGYVKTNNITVYAADTNGNIITGKVWTETKFGENIAVSVTGTYHAFLPNLLLMKSNISVSAKSVM